MTASRSGKVISTLVGACFAGLVSSDRSKSYQLLPPERRQLWWAHLIRNFRALAERHGRLGAWAADLLSLSELVFQRWHGFRAGTIDRAQLQLATFFVLVIGEELGWRGSALPRLQARFGGSGASLILGLLWAGWHLPNQIIPGLEFYGYGFPAFALYVVAMTVLFT